MHETSHTDAARTRPLTVTTRSREDTTALGARLAAGLAPGDVVVLRGTLGAGKTVLTQGIGRGLGVREPIISPTFTLLREYHSGRLPLYHVDAYRLAGPVEALTFGLDEYLYGDGVTVVEWGERVSPLLPPDHLAVAIDYGGPGERTFRLVPHGSRYHALLTVLADMESRP
jgi:tRNA threonylcarbamoyladenosine biosynthesis protein TsaE